MKTRAWFGVLFAPISVMLLVACVRIGLSDPDQPVPGCSEPQTCVTETPCMLFAPDGTSTCCPGPAVECGIITPQPTETPCAPASACPTPPEPCPLGPLSDCPPCPAVMEGEFLACPPPCLAAEMMPCYITPEPTLTPCDPASACPTLPKPCPLYDLSDCPPCPLLMDSGESFACPPPCPPDETMPCYITPWSVPVPSDRDSTCLDPCLFFDGSSGVACATPCLMVGPGVISTCCPGPAAECFVTPLPTPTPCDSAGATCPPCPAIEGPYIEGCPPPCVLIDSTFPCKL